MAWAFRIGGLEQFDVNFAISVGLEYKFKKKR